MKETSKMVQVPIHPIIPSTYLVYPTIRFAPNSFLCILYSIITSEQFRSREHMVRTPGRGDTTESIQSAFQDLSLKEPSISKAKAKSDLKASSKKHEPKPNAGPKAEPIRSAGR